MDDTLVTIQQVQSKAIDMAAECGRGISIPFPQREIRILGEANEARQDRA